MSLDPTEKHPAASAAPRLHLGSPVGKEERKSPLSPVPTGDVGAEMPTWTHRADEQESNLPPPLTKYEAIAG